jgi:hypothetical protein
MDIDAGELTQKIDRLARDYTYQHRFLSPTKVLGYQDAVLDLLKFINEKIDDEVQLSGR